MLDEEEGVIIAVGLYRYLVIKSEEVRKKEKIGCKSI